MRKSWCITLEQCAAHILPLTSQMHFSLLAGNKAIRSMNLWHATVCKLFEKSLSFIKAYLMQTVSRLRNKEVIVFRSWKATVSIQKYAATYPPCTQSLLNLFIPIGCNIMKSFFMLWKCYMHYEVNSTFDKYEDSNHISCTIRIIVWYTEQITSWGQ